MILITGASTGIGFATAQSLADTGFQILAGCRNEEDMQKLKRENITPIRLDVANEDDLRNLAQVLAHSESQLKVVINNAGVLSVGPLEYMPIDEIKKIFEVNVWGLLQVTQICLPFLRKTKGKIINMSSISGRTVTPFLGPYNASKYCVEVFSDALRMELIDTGVQLSLIEPGSIQTPIWEKSLWYWHHLKKILPREAFDYYGLSLESFRILAEKSAQQAGSVDLVISCIHRIIDSATPKARYVIGRDAKIALLQNLLPTKWRDRMVWKIVNSYKLGP